VFPFGPATEGMPEKAAEGATGDFARSGRS
jgi:hypothetical protein